MVKISKHIPLPENQHNKKWGQTKYDFKDLEVGHSFPVSANRRHSVSTLAKKYGDQHGCRFTVRRDPDSQRGNFRCWRIA